MITHETYVDKKKEMHALIYILLRLFTFAFHSHWRFNSGVTESIFSTCKSCTGKISSRFVYFQTASFKKRGNILLSVSFHEIDFIGFLPFFYKYAQTFRINIEHFIAHANNKKLWLMQSKGKILCEKNVPLAIIMRTSRHEMECREKLCCVYKLNI